MEKTQKIKRERRIFGMKAFFYKYCIFKDSHCVRQFMSLLFSGQQKLCRLQCALVFDCADSALTWTALSRV